MYLAIMKLKFWVSHVTAMLLNCQLHLQHCSTEMLIDYACQHNCDDWNQCLALPPILVDPRCRKVGSAHSIVFPPYMSRPCKYWKLNCQFTTYTLACGDSDWWNTIFRFVNFPIPIWFSKHGVYNKLWELPMYELAVLDLLWWVTW